MTAFFATLHKEILLLLRDQSGLALLFLMPMALVLVVSLVQDNVLRMTAEGSIRVLLIDRDGGDLGRRLAEGLRASGAVRVVTTETTDDAAVVTARRQVAEGDYPVCLVIPEGLSREVARRAELLARSALTTEGPANPPDPPAVELSVYFDPTVQGVFRGTVVNALQRVALTLEVAEKGRMLGEVLPQRVAEQIERSSGIPRYLPGAPQVPKIRFAWQDQTLMTVRAETAGEVVAQPDSVQQNVPAWTLFGMFFIVVPLSGVLLRERQEGTLRRLLTLPVSTLPLLTGKLAAYVLAGLTQALLMLLAGRLALPLFGVPMLHFGNDPVALVLLILVCALAATSYGILIGVLVRSYEQAAMVGPLSVVLAAAVGGVMVPTYAMPPAMQKLSGFSPLAWGLNGFLELFVRRGDLAAIAPELAALSAFAAATLALAWLVFARRRNCGR